MPENIPERADLRQLRTQAKELLRSLHTDPANEHAKLADAQRQLARQHGFPSWPALVTAVEKPLLLRELKETLEGGDANELERLLRSKRPARKLLNEPLFTFDTPPLIWASRHPNSERLLPILVRYGADPNVRSTWWAGGFSALDFASESTVEQLLDLGATFDVWSAAAHGRVDVLTTLLDRDPSSVNAPGGDGAQPLHFASTPEVAELLIARGADLEARDVDHEGTPVQHHVNRPDIMRVLIDHGAKPDVFTAVALDDLPMLRRILAESPEMLDARVGHPPFTTVKSDGGHIYAYRIGSRTTPIHLAAERQSRNVLEELQGRVRPAQRLLAAAWEGDSETVATLRREHPNIGREMGADERAIADAAQAGRTETVRLLLEAGLDPKTPGLDTGSALHTGCWFGYPDVVKLLLSHVPLDLKDQVHGSPPLGWAVHGAQWCRNPKGDYLTVVELLLQAGADPTVPANHAGSSMLEQAGQREDVKELLRRYGAR